MRFFEHNSKKICGTFMALATIVLWQNNANADSCTTSGTGDIDILQITGTCANCVIETYDDCGDKTYRVQNCTSCLDSKVLTTQTATLGTCTVTYKTCEKSGTTITPGSGTIQTPCDDSDCTSPKPTYWLPTEVQTIGGGYYEYSNDYDCTGSKETECKWTTSGYIYRCAAGYYGKANCTSPKSSCTGCTECKKQDGSYGTTNPTTDATYETSCYKDKTIKSTNDYGTYEFDGTCNYSN